VDGVVKTAQRVKRANVRIIPRLDIKGPNLVKGIHLEGLRVLGKPEQFARHYYEMGADELVYMDVVASLYGRNSLLEIVERTSKEIFIPLTVGGGLRTLDDIRTVLRAGADKVSLNTAAIRNPEFVREATNKFGSSTILVSIEALRKPDGRYEAFTDNGREKTGVDAFEWALRAAELGAGEIMVTSIDREGTGTGFDLELTRRIAESVSIPVIACGGAGHSAHVHEVVDQAKADAVSIASILHYDFIRSHPSDADFSSEGNIEYLRKGRSFSKVRETTLPDLKKYLIEQGVDCRPAVPEVAHA
jgi:cyclase